MKVIMILLWHQLQLVFRLFLLLLFCTLTSLHAIEVYEKVYLNEKAALERCFPDSGINDIYQLQLNNKDISQIQTYSGALLLSQNIQIFSSKLSPKTYAVMSHEQGKYRPITLMTLIKDAKVIDVMIMIYREKIGSKVRKKRFLKQFFGKNTDTPLQIDYDIDGISGATVSSWAVASGVKKGLYIAQELAKR